VTSITHTLYETWVDTADISLRCISFYNRWWGETVSVELPPLM
jgi:hypothetical protein